MASTYDFIAGFGLSSRGVPNPLPAGYGIDLHGKGNHFRGFVREDFTRESHYRTGDGWKIHLSIDPKDLPRAWDRVIAPILLDARVGSAKFAVGNHLANMARPGDEQAGKTVTVHGSGNRAWDAIARDMEIGLAREGITPGPAIAGDRMVPGSAYIGYRNERAFDALGPYGDRHGYLASDEIRRAVSDGVVAPGWDHNPCQRADPFQNIDFSSDPDVTQALAATAPSQPDAGWASDGLKASGVDRASVPTPRGGR